MIILNSPSSVIAALVACIFLLPSGVRAQDVSLEAVEGAVMGMPEQSSAEQSKRAVLEIALERARASAAVGMQDKARALLADIRAAMAVPAEAMARQATSDATNLAVLKAVPVTTNNPYLDGLAAWGKDWISKPEAPWARATLTSTVMPGLSSRERGEEIRKALWLYANPASPSRGNPELLKRLLRRCHAFIDAAHLNADPAVKVRTEIYDQFATEAGVSGLVEFLSLYPGLLLPSQRGEWDAGMRTIYNNLWPEMKRAKNWNLNIETARMVAMLQLGYYYKKQEVIDKVFRHVDGTLAKMRPDGGFPCNGDSNPSVNYHNALVGSLTRIYDISGYEPIARALIATQWKGPVMGRTDEFWTSPFHKTYRWNYERGAECGNQMVITLRRNPYANLLRGQPGGPDRDAIAWYRAGLPFKPMPDNYTIVDRNVDGPRAWYGRFNYAATFHAKDPKENDTGGHETLMGAMTVDEGTGRVNSILVNATPKVKVASEDSMDAKGSVKSSAWAQLTAGVRAAYLTGRHYSASAAAYGLTTMRGHAYQGKTTDWRGRQVWLGLPDRIVGLLSTVPSKHEAGALEIHTVLRLISGGTAGAAVCKELVKTGENRYRYGELDIIIHQSNFAAVTMDVIPYRRKNFPASELTFRAKPGGRDTPETYPATAQFHCVVEVRPIWAAGDAKVEVNADGPLLSLDARLGGKHWHMVFNAGDKQENVVMPVDAASPAATSLRVSGTRGGLPDKDFRASFALPPAQIAVTIESPDPIDHLPGWDSFEAMVK